MWMLLLAQAAAADTPADQPWWYLLLDQALVITLVAIFLTAVVVLILQQRRRDKCLKLFRKSPVTYLNQLEPEPMWGKLYVYPQALEVEFDAPYINRRGIVKSSSLLYKEDVEKCLAICRCAQGLTAREAKRRRKQVRRRIRPWFHRRAWRWIRNLFNSLRDAFTKSLSLLIGQIAKTKPQSQLAQQQGSVQEIGQTILGVAGNMHEPILERHIGKPVVLTLATPHGGEVKSIELPGFLIDYSDKYLAIFNRDHEALESIDVTLTEPVEREGFRAETKDGRIRITATGVELLRIITVDTGEAKYELNTVLLPGGVLSLPDEGPNPTRLQVERTRRVDIIAPRALASVDFSADHEEKRSWLRGLAPFEKIWRREKQEAADQAGESPPTPTESKTATE